MSQPEELFHSQIRSAGLPEPFREWQFDAERKFRFDFAWPYIHVAVEIEGGIWIRGRHTRGGSFERDCRKYNLAASQKWFVFRFSPGMVESGEAVEFMKRIMLNNG